MTLEEAIQLAENGDVGAIISLGNYYMQQNTGDGIQEAAKWYEKAAKQDVLYAIHMTVITKKIMAYAGMQVAKQVEMGTEFLIDDWNEVYDWAAKELDCINNKVPGAENIDINEAIYNFEEASYYLALCYYWESKYVIAKELLNGFEDTRSKILYGATLLQLTQSNNEAFEALQYLDKVIKDDKYAKSEKDALEEDVYALVALQVSMLHRIAGSQIDLECAVSVLKYTLEAVQYDNNKQILNKELGRYQKKMFGGYKYV